MSILNDLVNEVQNYPHEYLDIEIVEVTPSVGNKVNQDEEVQFRFRVTNRGPLDVENASFLIEGLGGTQIKEGNGAAAPWGTSYTTPPGYFPRVPAHQAGNPVVSNGSRYTFRPTSTSTSPTDLVRVSVAGWDTHLNHVMEQHSRGDAAAQGTYRAKVFPK